MKHLFSGKNPEILRQLAAGRALLAFDFDGTLAPIVADRDEARMRAVTQRAFDDLCRLYPCAVISGRGRKDVMGRLGGAKVKYVIGNHGLEPSPGLASHRKEVQELREALIDALRAVSGVDIEDKRYSLAIHYRHAEKKGRARGSILRAVEGLSSAPRVVLGKQVVNVLPEGAPDKGDALLALRARTRSEICLYVGDDVTDEDVFRRRDPGRLLTIRVGASRSSDATYYLRDQRAIDKLLENLLALRDKRRAP